MIFLWKVEPYDDTLDHEESLNSTKEKSETTTKIKPVIVKNWNKLQYLIEQEEIIKENLRTERLILEMTRKQFVNNNKKWLQNVISDIITPRTLILNKEKIIKVLKKKYKEREPERQFPPKSPKEMPKESQDQSQEIPKDIPQQQVNQNEPNQDEQYKKAYEQYLLEQSNTIPQQESSQDMPNEEINKLDLIKIFKKNCS